MAWLSRIAIPQLENSVGVTARAVGAFLAGVGRGVVVGAGFVFGEDGSLEGRGAAFWGAKRLGWGRREMLGADSAAGLRGAVELGRANWGLLWWK